MFPRAAAFRKILLAARGSKSGGREPEEEARCHLAEGEGAGGGWARRQFRHPWKSGPETGKVHEGRKGSRTVTGILAWPGAWELGHLGGEGTRGGWDQAGVHLSSPGGASWGRLEM